MRFISKAVVLFSLVLLTYTNAFATLSSELHLYNWSEYLPNSIIQEFTKETGIKVILSTYDSNEAMFTKLRLLGDKAKYDLVAPSSYYVEKLKHAGLLKKINKNKIPNLKNIDASFLNKPHDPNNEYSMPYLWGFTGIAYNAKYIKDKVDSWDILFSPKYRNKVLVMDDMREVFDIALISLGYKGSDTNEEHLGHAYEKLKMLVPNVKVWNSESPKVLFINEEVMIGTCWNGEAYMAAAENPDIKFAFPKEGPLLWIDSFVIPKSAKNSDNAYKFIDFIFRPEISKSITEKIGYSTPNKEALKLLDNDLRNNQVVFPPKEYIAKGILQRDIGSATAIYGKYWEMLRSGANE